MSATAPSRCRLLARVTLGVALLWFVLGGAHAAWQFARRPFVLEFQAGSGSTWGEKGLATMQSAALEGLGFGLVALLCGVLALFAPRDPERPGERYAAAFLITLTAFFGWALSTWVAEDALPFLDPLPLFFVNLTGFAGCLVALAIFMAIATRMPRAPRGHPAATALAGSICAAIGGFAAVQILLARSGGWRSPLLLAAALVILVAALFLTGVLARKLERTVTTVGSRLAEGTLVPRPVTLLLGLLFLGSLAASAPFARLSALSQEVDYRRLESRGAPAGPNVVFVTIDTLRADHLSCYGYERPTSPFIDSIAAAGTRFADASSPAAWTKPSTGTLLTGLYPSRHGALYHGSSLHLPEGERTLAEAFQDAGYVTAGFVSNPNVKSVFAFDRGFDEFFDSPVEDTLTLACIRETFFGNLVMDLTRHQFNWKYENDVRQMNRHVSGWLAENSDQRFFLYIHYIDPHIPYSPPAEYRAQFAQDHGFPLFNERKNLVGRDLYDAEIRYSDAGIEELVQHLRELELWEDTLFVLTSDHGEEFFEHGVLGHGFSLYQPVVHVPMILHGPGIPSGAVVEEPVQIVDLAATVLEAAATGTDRLGDGRSVVGLIPGTQGRVDPARGPYFLENEFGQDEANQRSFVFTGVRQGPWKLVLTEANAFFPPQNPDNGAEALYHLGEDPGETTNLIAHEEHRAVIEGLLEHLRGHSQFLYDTGFRDVEPAALSPDVEANLRALGY